MKFVLFTYDCTGCSIALKMQQEGHDVIVGQIQNQDDILLDEQLRSTKPEKPELKERRLTKYNGMLKKVNAWKLLKFLQSQKPTKEWYVFMDLNYCWKFGEELLNSGFQGNFPTKYDRMLEVKRDRAKEFVQKHYPDVKVAEYHSFKKIQEGISFIKKAKITYVLKSLGDAGDTIVPKSDDPNMANEQLTGQLKSQKKDYEQVGFILEERIDSPIELTPQIVFYEGDPVYTTLDIENKSLFAGNVGPNTGCSQNLIVKTNIDAAVNKIAFPPIVYELAKQRRGYFIWDISLLFDKSGVPYFGEFCSGRPGWDAMPTEIAMSGSKSGNKIATPYFQKIIKKENPLIVEYGAGVRIFNVTEGKMDGGERILWDEEAEPDIYLYDAKKEGKSILATGYEWDSAVITGVGKTEKEAIERCYKYVDMYHLPDKGYRIKSDFLSTEYRTSILNRLNFTNQYNLI